jgi:hypothetical protein
MSFGRSFIRGKRWAFRSTAAACERCVFGTGAHTCEEPQNWKIGDLVECAILPVEQRTPVALYVVDFEPRQGDPKNGKGWYALNQDPKALKGMWVPEKWLTEHGKLLKSAVSPQTVVDREAEYADEVEQALRHNLELYPSLKR